MHLTVEIDERKTIIIHFTALKVIYTVYIAYSLLLVSGCFIMGKGRYITSLS